MRTMLDQGIDTLKAVTTTVEQLDRHGYILKRGMHGCLREEQHTVSEKDYS